MQEQGFIGRQVGSMIRRSVRRRFHKVYARGIDNPLSAPAVLYANHHGWMDGYVMFHVVSALGLPSVDWIEEFDAFPLFRTVGGMPFPRGDSAARAATVRQTIRLMNQDKRSLVVFPEGTLHRPPNLLPLGKALSTIARHVPHASFVPVAIAYEMSLHERPEAWISIGPPHPFAGVSDCQTRLQTELDSLRSDIGATKGFIALSPGTADVNERMKFPSRRLR